MKTLLFILLLGLVTSLANVFRPLGMTTAGTFAMVSGPDELDSP